MKFQIRILWFASNCIFEEREFWMLKSVMNFTRISHRISLTVEINYYWNWYIWSLKWFRTLSSAKKSDEFLSIYSEQTPTDLREKYLFAINGILIVRPSLCVFADEAILKLTLDVRSFRKDHEISFRLKLGRVRQLLLVVSKLPSEIPSL